MGIGVLDTLEALVDSLDIAVDADELSRVFRLREKLLAKSMTPLREFDKAGLYQLSKASCTKQFLQRTVGLAEGDAGAVLRLARVLGSLPETGLLNSLCEVSLPIWRTL